MSETMNIYADEGDKVKFSYPKNGYDSDIAKAQSYLEVGEIYTVDSTEVYSSSTDVYLKEVPNVSFNSVMFSKVVDSVNTDKKQDYKFNEN